MDTLDKIVELQAQLEEKKDNLESFNSERKEQQLQLQKKAFKNSVLYKWQKYFMQLQKVVFPLIKEDWNWNWSNFQFETQNLVIKLLNWNPGFEIHYFDAPRSCKHYYFVIRSKKNYKKKFLFFKEYELELKMVVFLPNKDNEELVAEDFFRVVPQIKIYQFGNPIIFDDFELDRYLGFLEKQIAELMEQYARKLQSSINEVNKSLFGE